MTRTIYTEEPDAGKLACPVLKTNGSREGDVEFNKIGATPSEQLHYLGLALYGKKEIVNKLTGSLPLLR